MEEQRKSVLVVDADEQLLIYVQRLLEDEGFDTVTCWTAEEAFDLLESRSFDAIVVGDHLPDSTCEELIREIQTRGVPASIVVMESVAKRAPSNASYYSCLGAGATVRRRDFGEVLRSVKMLVEHRGNRATAA